MAVTKSFYHTAVNQKTLKRLDAVRIYMTKTEPEKYDEDTSYHEIIKWLLDNVPMV